MPTALDIIQSAFELIKVYAPGETAVDADASRGFIVLNDMIDQWSNEALAMFANLEQSATLIVGENSYTIGSGGNFNMTRPLDILTGPGAAYLQDTNGNNYPMDVVTQDKWNLIGNRATTITSNVPDTLFYDPQYPLGIINVFPTPNIAYVMFWDSRLQLTDFSNLQTPMSLPPGYSDALKKNLAVELVSYYPTADPSPILVGNGPGSAYFAKGNVKRTNMKLNIAVFDPEIISRGTPTYNIYRDNSSTR